MKKALVAVVLAALLISTQIAAAATGGIDLRLTVVAPPGLAVQFWPEGIVGTDGQPQLLDLEPTSDVPDSGLPCVGGRCYQLRGQGRITGNVRGGMIMIYQQSANAAKRLVGRDPITWTFQPGTVADLVALYGLDATGNLRLLDFRRTDVQLTPIAAPRLDPDLTPLAAESQPISATTTLTTQAANRDQGFYLGCGGFLVLVAVLLLGTWLVNRRKGRQIQAGASS